MADPTQVVAIQKTASCKTGRVNGIVGQKPSEAGLEQEEKNHHEKEFGRGELTGSEGHIDELLRQRYPLGGAVPQSVIMYTVDKYTQDD
jgi:hypothetical protein